ncbi:MarR family winged helix-turn-helix transcriptional regulator [Actinomadura sp. NTSP31]|uniref:MarR family winged helix-turn-helix transcriptional regulator n=1 Tax=Actinomadura sp. NTSP31 TaxID=1735447 RepID=UPI0035C0D5E3
MSSEAENLRTLNRTLDALTLLSGSWPAPGIQGAIMRRSGVAIDVATAVLLLKLAHLGGSARPSLLGRTTHTNASTVSKTLARMTAAGLVHRAAEQGDLRAVSITLTPRGHAAVEAINNAGMSILDEAVKDWPIEDIRRFARYLQRLAQALTPPALD